MSQQPTEQRPPNCGTGFCSCIECPYTTAKPAQQEPVAIKWELNGDKTCRYDNWLGTTPFGRILITWKSWKDFPEACVDEFPGDFQAYGDPDDVKDECEKEYARRCGAAAQQREFVGLTEVEVGMLTVFDGLHHVESPLLADFIRAIEARLREKNGGGV